MDRELESLVKLLNNIPKFDNQDRAKRVTKSKSDFRYFVNTYFAHHIGNYEDKSEFRNFLYKNLDTQTQTNRNLLFLSYRGSAKTTLIAIFFTLWKIAKAETKFTIIISNTIDVAINSLDFIKTEIELNINFKNDFNIKEGDIWQNSEIVIYKDDKSIKIKAFGSGKKIRGENYLGNRPDLIILDDIENDENVESKTQRDKLYKWFSKAILKLPSRQSTTHNIIVVGTLLHCDALLSKIMNRADFRVFNFKLVKSFPKNMHSWQELYNFKDSQKALKIYKKEQKEFDDGYELDDPNLNKFEIMMEYFEDIESFMSEYQNVAISKEGAMLSDYSTYQNLPNLNLNYYFGIDLALGKTKGDYSAITILAQDTNKQLYCIYSRGFRVKPIVFIDKIIELYKKYTPIKVAIETVAFQEFFKDILKQKAKNQDIYMPIVEINNTKAKELRIDGLSVYLKNRDILINPNEAGLIDELLTYPKSKNDDHIDSLEMAFRVANKSNFDYKEANRRWEILKDKFNSLKERF